MRTLTLGQAKATIARVSNLCDTSARVVELLNEAQERLLNRTDYPVGSLVRYRFCAGSSGCITWPRQVRTIQAWANCSTPGMVKSNWFEFIGYPVGIGLQDGDTNPGNMLIDRGMACAFDDVIATTAAPRKICAIATNAADVGKYITLRYINSTGQRVYTSIDGVVQEGERLTLVAPGGVFPAGVAQTTYDLAPGGLYHVVKATTLYPVALYECSSTALTRQLAFYEPSETVPIYRRSLIPGLEDMTACDDATSDCTQNKSITALVKLQHVPVVVDNDPLVIGNLAALKLMVMAIVREEQNRHDEAAVLEGKAARELDGEASSYMGDGTRDVLKVGPDFGAGQPIVAIATGWY